jgi:signal transduction histidine kinase
METDIVKIIVISTAVLFIFAVAYIFILLFAKKMIVREQTLKIIEIQKHEKKYRELFERSIVGMVEIQIEPLVILEANVKAFTITGCKTIADLNDKISFYSPLIQNEFQTKLKDPGFVQEKEILLENNHWILFSAQRGDANIATCSMIDITEKRRLELYSIRAQKMESIALLTSSISHDLQNILAPVLMSICLLKDDPMNPNNGKILDAIEQSTQNGLELVKNILQYGRGLKGGKKNLIEINAFLENTINDFMISGHKNITIERYIDKNKYFISADEQQLTQVFLNLFNNALDAVSHDGKLTITLKQSVENIEVVNEYPSINPEHFVEVVVQDNGSGISTEDQFKIFDPFYTTKTNGQGTGLGLSIVQNIIKYHDGLVTVDSSVGKGTAFHVFLPMYLS